MDTRRLGLALVIALVISIVITSIFYVRFTKQQAAQRPKTRKVLAAATAIQPGTALTAENVAEIDWRTNVPLDGAVEKREDLIGRVLAYPLPAKEPIRTRDLASNGSSISLTAKIPVGMRAVAVRTNEVNNIAGFLVPGSHVDVLLTLHGDNNTTFTRTVMQNVEVLSTGTKIQADPDGKPENVAVVTVLVTPEDSQKLVLAGLQGPLQFALRNSGDTKISEIPREDVALLMGASKPSPATEAPTMRRKKIGVAPIVYTVETVAGGKSSIAEFRGKSQ